MSRGEIRVEHVKKAALQLRAAGPTGRVDGAYVAKSADGTERASIAYLDYGTLHLSFAGDATYAPRLLADVAADARRRGVKLLAAEEPLLHDLLHEDPSLRDVREPALGTYVTTKRTVLVDAPLRTFFRQVTTRLEKLTATPPDPEDESWRAFRSKGRIAMLGFTPEVSFEFPAPMNVTRRARLARSLVVQLAKGEAKSFDLDETTRTPDAAEGVADAERFVDELVADGSVELRDGDEPSARHAQVFAVAERLSLPLASWRAAPKEARRAATAELASWLEDQPEIDDVFIDDRDLEGRLFV